jgi:nucleoside-diphosphate kinase
MTKKQAEGFYAVHKIDLFFRLDGLYVIRPYCVMILDERNAIASTGNDGLDNYKEAEQGTIRKDLQQTLRKNVVHGSDSPDRPALKWVISSTFETAD